MNSIEDVRQLEACYETTITQEHLDEYGHMNVKWYAQLWGSAASGFMNRRGLDFVKDVEFGIGYWVLRQVIDFTAEVLEGDHITIYGRMVNRTDKLMHNMYWMVNDTQEKVAATSQVLVGNADLNKRRLTPFSDEVAQRLDGHIAHCDELGWYAETTGGIELNAGKS